MRKSLALVSLIASSLLVMPACGDGGSTGNTPPTTLAPTASFAATVSPNPIIADACTPALCGNTGLQFVAVATVTVTESGGVGGNVNFVNVTLRNATTNVEVGTLNYTANDIIALAGTNHVNGRSSLSIPRLGAAYRLSGGGRQATMTFTLSIADDRGNPQNQVVVVPVV